MSLSLDPRTTALVLIDVQKGILPLPLAPYDAARIVENGATLGRRFAEAGATLVLVHVAYSSSYADKPSQAVDVPMPAPPGGLPAQWSEFAPEIEALPADIIITKRQWGAFHGTELDLQLRRRGITTIVLGGIATNFGVESTAREAWQHNYAVVVVEDACTSVGTDLHRFSVENILPRVARVRRTAEIAAALQSA
ncbi:Nicotinamidase-related amidase [Rhizobiales bacterium GAS191]|nr:Nicotinamidase-related amidase [Rhizobiales bacterium GAS191]